jgi:hypothetical protein
VGGQVQPGIGTVRAPSPYHWSVRLAAESVPALEVPRPGGPHPHGCQKICKTRQRAIFGVGYSWFPRFFRRLVSFLPVWCLVYATVSSSSRTHQQLAPSYTKTKTIYTRTASYRNHSPEPLMALDPLKTWALSANAAAALQVSSGIELLVTAAANNQLQLLKHAIELQGIPVDVLLQWGPPGGFATQQRTLCQIAACSGCFDAVHYLLSKGADPNGKSPDDGYTALHCAAASGHPRTAEIIAVLLHFGGSRDVLDASGRKPVDLLAELIDVQHGVVLPQMEGGEVGVRQSPYC